MILLNSGSQKIARRSFGRKWTPKNRVF